MAISLRKYAIGFMLLSLLAACSSKDKQTGGEPQINQAESLVKPKMVIQLGHQKPVIAVQWINDGKNLVSLGADGAIMFWDVKTGVIVDSAQVPTNEDPDHLKDMWFQDFRLDDDKKAISIFYYSQGYDYSAEYDRDNDACVREARGQKGWCSYKIDINSRLVTADGEMTPPENFTRFGNQDDKRKFPLSPDGLLRAVNVWHNNPDIILAEVDRPHSDERDCDVIKLCDYPIHLVPIAGSQAPMVLKGNPPSLIFDIDLSADGRRLVKLQAVKSFNQTRVEALDLSNGAAQPPYDLDRHYSKVWVLDDNRYAVIGDDAAGNSTKYANYEEPVKPASLIVDPHCAKFGDCRQIETYEQMLPFDTEGNFLGVAKRVLVDGNSGLDSELEAPCFAGNRWGCVLGAADDRYTTKLSLNFARDERADGDWELLRQPDWQGQEITATQISPDRSKLAVATSQIKDADPYRIGYFRIWLFDLVGDELQPSPREIFKNEYRDSDDFSVIVSSINGLDFTPDSQRIIFTQIGDASTKFSNLFVINMEQPSNPKIFPNFSRFASPVSNNRIFGVSNHELIDSNSGEIIAKDFGKVTITNNGTVDRSRLFWSADRQGVVEFRDSNDASLQLTLYLFPDNRFFVMTPGGRYDTNLGADTNVIRWTMPDSPWQSLGAQTFMRDFYEPGLYSKLLDCREADNCGDILKSLPSIESLNRVLPVVTIIGVKAGKDASEAIVSIKVSQGVDPTAANGKTRSGIYNPRLFRNGRVVAMNPDKLDAVTDTLEKWRQLNDVSDKRDPFAPTIHKFTVPLPTGAGTEHQEFSAYAFNEDRIKSETANFTYERPPLRPRKPRAFVIAIGIDDYKIQRFRLNYAVADARLIAERLADISGYDMRRLTLAGERRADGSRASINSGTIKRILSLITTNIGRDKMLKMLRDEENIDASMLEQATPDDIVIISFSGHGWADKQGNFYLIPTNGYWDAGSETPKISSVLATADLARYFRAMQAREISFIIDACHSAASVASGQFKPGPMGDSGLGQLAFDKGIRILAATQSDDVAIEDARLKQGLLTYALVGEGLTPTGGKADSDGDRRIRLDEWLNYAVDRLPSLSEDVRVGHIAAPSGNGTRAIVFNDLPPDAPKRRVQKPSLFDFNTKQSDVILRRNVQ